MKPIDQIMVRKLGGWNLIQPNDWVQLPLAERDALLADDAVQFFGDGAQVDTMEAVATLSPDMDKPETTKRPVRRQPPSGSRQPTGANISELVPVGLVSATYTRHVIAGPAWQIKRAELDQPAVPFAEFRGHANDDVYDVSNTEGTLLLISDLMTDAFGHTGNSKDLISNEAARHFDDYYFDATLGDRFWEVTAKDIRAQVAKNPYVRLLNNA